MTSNNFRAGYQTALRNIQEQYEEGGIDAVLEFLENNQDKSEGE